MDLNLGDWDDLVVHFLPGRNDACSYAYIRFDWKFAFLVRFIHVLVMSLNIVGHRVAHHRNIMQHNTESRDPRSENALASSSLRTNENYALGSRALHAVRLHGWLAAFVVKDPVDRHPLSPPPPTVTNFRSRPTPRHVSNRIDRRHTCTHHDMHKHAWTEGMIRWRIRRGGGILFHVS